MSSVHVRAFRRDDREQVALLVNGHVAAVVPGVSVSVNAVMSQLEREPGEFIVDPWVIERRTLIAEQRQRIVAAAHLVRYAADDRVGEWYGDSGEIRWFVFWPEAPSGGPAVHRSAPRIHQSADRTGPAADGRLRGPDVDPGWPWVHGLEERISLRRLRPCGYGWACCFGWAGPEERRRIRTMAMPTAASTPGPQCTRRTPSRLGPPQSLR